MNIVEVVHICKKCWEGHIGRIMVNRWTQKRAEERDVKRKCGRPPTQWVNSLWKTYDKTWERIAANQQILLSCDLQ